MDDLVLKLDDGKIFSKLDLRAGYQQLLLDEDSRYITAFETRTLVHALQVKFLKTLLEIKSATSRAQ